MDIQDTEEEKGLLRDDERDTSRRPRFQPQPTGRRRLIATWFDVYFLVIHILLLLALVAIVYLSFLQTDDAEELTIFPGLRYLKSSIVNEHTADRSDPGNFAGPPSNTNTVAWQRLLRPLYFNASAKELTLSNMSVAEAVKVGDGGYMASLGVYHELNCLNQLRYFLYSDQFVPNLNTEDEGKWKEHLDHCIEVIRLSSMCKADTSLYTFTWPEEDNTPFLDAHSNSPRKCADWKTLEDWAGDRRIYDQTVLLKPGGDVNRTVGSLGVEDREN